MNALVLAVISIIGFLLAYFLYARFLQEKIFRLFRSARKEAARRV